MTSLFAELKRRNVFRVGIAYAITAWLLAQVADVFLENFGAPQWVIKTFLLALLAGFPIAVIFAWAFELTPEGIRREKDVDRSQSITPKTGKKLNNTIVVLLTLAVAYLLFDKFHDGSTETAAPADQQAAQVMQAEPETPQEATSQSQKARRLSIAVLPFANRSRLEDDEFFAEGMHDDLLTQLAKIGGLKVVSRTSAIKYRDTTLSLPEIAAELGVGTILEGGVQRAGDRVRINAQLIDVATDEHLWAETFDRQMTLENLFEIQSEITRQIVSAVRGELSAEEAAALAEAPTDSLAAYEAYLKARSVMQRWNYDPANYREALPWNQKALELDPEFAAAWAQQAMIRGQLVWMRADNSEAQLSAVREAMEKANRYGLGQPEVLKAQAEVYYRLDNDFRAARNAAQAVVKLRPGDAQLWDFLGVAQRRSGDYEAAISSFETSMELDPNNPQTRNNLVATLMYARRYEEARQLAQRWLEEFPDAYALLNHLVEIWIKVDGDLERARNAVDRLEPRPEQAYLGMVAHYGMMARDYQRILDMLESPMWGEYLDQPGWAGQPTYFRGTLYELLGNTSRAEQLYRDALDQLKNSGQISGRNLASNLLGRAAVHSALNEHEPALSLMRQALEIHPPERSPMDWSQNAEQVAWVRARAGQVDEALDILAQELSGPGQLTAWNLRLSPLWDFMRDDPRFQALATPDNRREGAL